MHRQPNLAVPSRRKNCGWPVLGCPVQSMAFSGAGVAPARGPRRWSFSLRACVTIARRWRPFSCHGKQSHHLTSPSLQRPRLGLFSSSPCFTVTQVGTVSLSRTPAHLAPAAIVAPPNANHQLVYQTCVLRQENDPLHTASGRALPTRVKRKPDVDIQSIGNLPESVSRKSQGSPFLFSHCPALPARQPTRPKASQSNGGAALQFQVDGPFLHPPIRALRNGSHYGMIFRHPQTFPLPTPNDQESPALEEGVGGTGKGKPERSKCSLRYYNGSRSQNGPAFSFLALSNLAPLPD